MKCARSDCAAEMSSCDGVPQCQTQLSCNERCSVSKTRRYSQCVASECELGSKEHGELKTCVVAKCVDAAHKPVNKSAVVLATSVTLLPPSFVAALTPAVGTPPPFYIYQGAAFDMNAALGCAHWWREDDQSAEVAMLRQLEIHPARVHAATSAQLFVVPALPYISYAAGTCKGSTHDERMRQLAKALHAEPTFQRRGGRDHVLVSNTFRFAAFRALKSLLANATVGWFEQPTAAPASSTLHSLARKTWRCTVVVPYLANPHCGGGGAPSSSVGSGAPRAAGSVFFQGSWAAAANVRSHFKELQGIEGVDVRDVPRGVGAAGVDSSKAGTARAMAAHDLCLVPKGDTPSSGRLFSAMACGCLPLLISARLLAHLPYRRAARYEEWLHAINEEAFKDSPRAVLETVIAKIGPNASLYRERMRRAAAELLYNEPGSNVATNLLLEWKQSCSG